MLCKRRVWTDRKVSKPREPTGTRLTCGDELEPAAEDHPEGAEDDEVHDGRLLAVGHRRPPVLVAELEEPLEALPLLGQPGVDHLDQ